MRMVQNMAPKSSNHGLPVKESGSGYTSRQHQEKFNFLDFLTGKMIVQDFGAIFCNMFSMPQLTVQTCNVKTHTEVKTGSAFLYILYDENKKRCT